MPNEFAITATTDRLALGTDRRGNTSFTVSNMTDRQLRARARVVPTNPEAADWFTIAEPERDIPASETQQFTVDIAVPGAVPAGEYTVRLDVVGVENPDEQYAQGPGIAVIVPGELVQTSSSFPWWIVAVAGVIVMLVAAVAVVLLLLDGDDDDGRRVTGVVSPAPGNGGPDVISQGDLAMGLGFFIDLDAGSVQRGGQLNPEADFVVRGQDVSPDGLVPVNGARIEFAGSTEPGAEGCAALQLGSQAIPIEQVAVGDFYCVRTSDGNLSQLRIDDASIRTDPPVFVMIEATFSTFAG